jgi:hypothetical protein
VPSCRERRQWRREFKDRGVDNVRLMVSHSNFGEEKLRYARRWIRQQEILLPAFVKWLGAVLATVVAALLVWLGTTLAPALLAWLLG